MSEFADYLRDYMKKKSVTKSKLSQKLEKDRGTISRYVSGERIPLTEEGVLQIARALDMKEEEWKEWVRYYEYESIGKTKVLAYEEAMAFLSSLNEISEDTKQTTQVRRTYTDGVYEISTREEIYSMLAFMVCEAANMEERTVYVCMEPDCQILDHIISEAATDAVTVKHIMPLEEKIERGNLHLMSQLLRYCFLDNQYQIEFFYANVKEYFTKMRWMPNMIFAGKNVMMLDANRQTGLFLVNELYGRDIRKWYQKISAQTRCLNRKLASLTAWSQEFEGDTKENCIMLFCRQPCLSLCISGDASDAGMDIYDKMRQMSAGTKIECWFTRMGLIDFIKTGRVEGRPKSLQCPVSWEERVIALRRLLQWGRSGVIQLYLLEDTIPLPKDMYIQVDEAEDTILIGAVRERQIERIVLQEYGMCEIFYDFTRYLTEKNQCQNAQETLMWMERVLDQMIACKVQNKSIEEEM